MRRLISSVRLSSARTSTGAARRSPGCSAALNIDRSPRCTAASLRSKWGWTMARPGPLYCVTDKELYDALMSSKQQFNAGSLLELARGRGILLSSADDRPALADRLSAMIFGCEGI